MNAIDGEKIYHITLNNEYKPFLKTHTHYHIDPFVLVIQTPDFIPIIA